MKSYPSLDDFIATIEMWELRKHKPPLTHFDGDEGIVDLEKNEFCLQIEIYCEGCSHDIALADSAYPGAHQEPERSPEKQVQLDSLIWAVDLFNTILSYSPEPFRIITEARSRLNERSIIKRSADNPFRQQVDATSKIQDDVEIHAAQYPSC